MIWYITFKTLLHAERINGYKSGSQYTIIIQGFFSNAYSMHMVVNNLPHILLCLNIESNLCHVLTQLRDQVLIGGKTCP